MSGPAPAMTAIDPAVLGVPVVPVETGSGRLSRLRVAVSDLMQAATRLRAEGFADLALLTAEERALEMGIVMAQVADAPVAGERPDGERADVDAAQESRGPAGVTLIYGFKRRADVTTLLVDVVLDDPDLVAPSLCGLWAGAAPLEREVYDLFGVHFEGHPGLTRIVLRDDFEGHPLRKAHPMGAQGVTRDAVEIATASHGDTHLGCPDADEPSELTAVQDAAAPEDEDLRSQRLVLNMGPQHPSMHGVLHLWLALDGEKVVAARPTHGYLHRCIEKLCEMREYRACTALLDRCDYVSGFHTELAFMLALEELAEIETTPKGDFLRVLMSELVRITSHHTWYAAAGLDTGALTPFLYAFIDRELILDFFEEITGARMMFNYFRPGGVKEDLPAGTAARLTEYLKGFDKAVDEYEALLTSNEIFRARTRGVGMLSRSSIVDHCVTGPMARASGVDIDLRRDAPYAAYDRIPLNVALGEVGDTFDRYTVRIAEMRESARIALAALEGMPEGPHAAEGVPRTLKPPKGSTYREVESPRGELGVYLASDGSAHPWRLKVRSPAFSNLHSAGPLLEGLRVGDVVAVLGSVDVVMGEIDR